MKLSFSTNAFVRYSVIEAVSQIAALGYEGVELLADAPHLFAQTVRDADIRALKVLLDRTGLEVSNINANTAAGYYGRKFWEPLFEPSLANPDESARKWRIDYTKRCIDMARALGSPSVSITSGRMVPGTSPERGLGLLRESLTEVLEHAQEQCIKIGIEYEPGLLIECYDELSGFLEETDSAYLGANLDMGHSHILGENPERVVRGLGSKLFHIHIEDIRDGKHYHLIPGSGNMDFPYLFEILRAHSYEGFVTVELYTYPQQPEEAAEKSLRYLKAALQELG